VGPGHRAACHFAKPYPIDISKLDQKILDEAALAAVVGGSEGAACAAP
jgi:hypothetical protein